MVSCMQKGTPGYIAPELVPQLCGSCGEEEEHEEPCGAATMAVDIYSFGIVLWEIITGDSPQAANGRLRVPRCPYSHLFLTKLFAPTLLHYGHFAAYLYESAKAQGIQQFFICCYFKAIQCQLVKAPDRQVLRTQSALLVNGIRRGDYANHTVCLSFPCSLW